MKYLVSLKGKDYEVEVERGEAILVSVQDTPAPVVAARLLRLLLLQLRQRRLLLLLPLLPAESL